MLDARGWAEIRRMREVEGLSIHEIACRTGHYRNTVRRALRREGRRSIGGRLARRSSTLTWRGQGAVAGRSAHPVEPDLSDGFPEQTTTEFTARPALSTSRDRGFEPSAADQTPRLGNLRRRVSCRDLRVGTLDADAVLDVLL